MNPQAEKLFVVRRFAEACLYEKQHSTQVALLAGRLFDLLGAVHGLSVDQKWLLIAASLLHDIGWMQGQEHHKAAMGMILSDKTMTLEPQDRSLIALIARYHRKALPKESHPVYGQLSAGQRKTVDVLGGILRLADGLDRNHASAVQRLEVEVHPGLISVLCYGTGPIGDEIEWGQKKADLLEQSLNVKVRVTEGCT